MKTESLLVDLPPFEGRSVTVAPKQTVPRIMKEVVVAHSEYAADYDRIAEKFFSSDGVSTEKKLFDFCKNNFNYSIESVEKQTVRSPTAILVLGEVSGVDCKHYASFIGGVLDAINRSGYDHFNWFYRFASYDINDRIPEHVFVVVKYNGSELWVDPVLDHLDDRFPYPIWIRDEKPNAMALMRISGIGGKNKLGSPAGYESTNYATTGMAMRSGSCGCRSKSTAIRASMGMPRRQLGATGQQTGKTITSIVGAATPVLAVIPVVGWIAIAAGTVVGTFLTIFGSKYSTSTGVRWLVQMYEKFVLGLDVESDNEVSESYTADAQKWFSYVLGVPIYDQFRVHALKGTSPKNAQLLNRTREQRAQDYLDVAGDAVRSGVTFQNALDATYQADTLNFWAKPQRGAWANATVAPVLIKAQQDAANAATMQAGGIVSVADAGGVVPWIKLNPGLTAVGAAGIGFLLYKFLK